MKTSELSLSLSVKSKGLALLAPCSHRNKLFTREGALQARMLQINKLSLILLQSRSSLHDNSLGRVTENKVAHTLSRNSSSSEHERGHSLATGKSEIQLYCTVNALILGKKDFYCCTNKQKCKSYLSLQVSDIVFLFPVEKYKNTNKIQYNIRILIHSKRVGWQTMLLDVKLSFKTDLKPQ